MPSVEIVKKGDMMGISKIVNEEKDKNMNSGHLLPLESQKENVRERKT